MRPIRRAQWLGAGVALACAPFVAVADGLVVDPSYAQAPELALARRAKPRSRAWWIAATPLAAVLLTLLLLQFPSAQLAAFAVAWAAACTAGEGATREASS